MRDIAGGLTIMRTAKGQWISPEGGLFIERMIPVRIMCSFAEIERIAELTLDHYEQEAVMYYRVSEDVWVMNKS